MRSRRAIAALAAACAVSLTACQSADAVIAEYNDSGTTGYDTSTVQADPAVQALVPESVSADGRLVIGSNLYWAPATGPRPSSSRAAPRSATRST